MIMASNDRSLCLNFSDVKKAHLNGFCERKILVKLPPELGGAYALLSRSLYGTRDAAHNWELEIKRVFDAAGFVQGRSSPCVWRHSTNSLKVVIHGDDVVSVGSHTDTVWLRETLAAAWRMSERGCLSGTPQYCTTKHITCLNRLISVDDAGYTWEADPRHA